MGESGIKTPPLCLLPVSPPRGQVVPPRSLGNFSTYAMSLEKTAGKQFWLFQPLPLRAQPPGLKPTGQSRLVTGLWFLVFGFLSKTHSEAFQNLDQDWMICLCQVCQAWAYSWGKMSEGGQEALQTSCF